MTTANPRIARLQPYPFERLAELVAGIDPPAGLPLLRLSIGEPEHPPPPSVVERLRATADRLGRYPTARGEPELRAACASWATRRFGLDARPLDPERHVLPVCGTREGLFSVVQALVDPDDPQALVVVPNPFYQIYEGAALLAGARPFYVNEDAAHDYRPDFRAVPDAVWARCRLLVVCSPANPTGVVHDLETYRFLLETSDRHGFPIVADECYSEIYTARPPLGLLEAALKLGREDYCGLLVVHSLSKRSSVPGLRSGFVAGDPELIVPLARYRTYHGVAMPPPIQAASTLAWSDEGHVEENRALYRRKFAILREKLAARTTIRVPEGGFYLWWRIPGDAEAFVRALYREEHVLVLPGPYLSRPTPEGDPGRAHLRVSLVSDLERTEALAERLERFLDRHPQWTTPSPAR
jgi:N-succinyldiaminopimelate aminotransferase